MKSVEVPPGLFRCRREADAVLTVLKASDGPLDLGEISRQAGYSVSGVRSMLYLLQKHTGAVRLVALDDRRRVNLDGLSQYESVRRWLRNLREGPGRRSALYLFARFMNYLTSHSDFKTPDDLVNDAMGARMKELTKHLDLVIGFVERLEDVGKDTRDKAYRTVRSFYKHNRCPLPSEPLNHYEGEVVRDRGKESYMILEDVRKAVSHAKCNVRDRAIVITMVQSGMDDSTLAKIFNSVGYPQLSSHFGSTDWHQWDVEKCPVKIDLVRPKTGYRYYTFIDRDATSSLKDWLSVRYTETGSEIRVYEAKRQDELPKSDPIFIVGGEEPIRPYYISTIFRKLGFAAGINVRPSGSVDKYRGALRRYKFHSHEVRDIFKSLARVCGVDREVADFFLGRKIDEDGYDKSPWLYPEHFKQQYQMMKTYLNVISYSTLELEGLRKQATEMKDLFQRQQEQRDQIIHVLRKELDDYKDRLGSYSEVIEKMRQAMPTLLELARKSKGATT